MRPFEKCKVFAALILLLLFSGPIQAQFVEGQVAPSISLQKFGGGTLDLSDYNESIVFIYIFGST